MRKRVCSLLLALCLLVNLFPVQVLAEEWQEIAPEAVQSVEVETAALSLPVDNGLSLMGVESEPDTTILRQGVERLYLENLLLPGVAECPVLDMTLRLVDSQGTVRLETGWIDSSSYYDFDGAWYLSEIILSGLDTLPADLYTLQLVPMDAEVGGEVIGPAMPGTGIGGSTGADSGSTDSDEIVLASDGVIVLAKKLRIVEDDALILYRPFLEGFYTGVDSFTVWMNLDGFREADLDALRMTLTDDQGNLVAQTREEPGMLYVDSYNMQLTRRLYVEEDVLLDAEGMYTLQVHYDSERTLYTQFETVGVRANPDPYIVNVWVSDAVNAAVSMDVENYDPNTAYILELMVGGREFSYEGFLPAGGVVEIELDGDGERHPITWYGYSFNIDLYRLEDGEKAWCSNYYMVNPYSGFFGGEYSFEPRNELTSANSFPFTLVVPSAYQSDSYAVELMEADGTVVGTAADVAVKRAQGTLTLTGTMKLETTPAAGLATVVLNGEVVEEMNFRNTWWSTWSSWYMSGSGSFGCNFGQYPVRLSIFNGEDRGELRFVDMDDNVILSSGPLEAQSGMTPSYSEISYTFTQQQLDALTEGEAYRLEFAAADSETFYVLLDGEVYTAEKTPFSDFYLDQTELKMGSTELLLNLSLYDTCNLTLEDLLDGISLIHMEEVYEDGYYMGMVETPVTVTSASIADWQEPNNPVVKLELETPLIGGNYELLWQGSYQDNFYLKELAESYVYSSELRSGYLLAENLNPDGSYSCRIYDEHELLLELPLELEDGAPQYLYFDPVQTAQLPDGTYYLRVYQDGVLFQTAEETINRPTELIVTVSGSSDEITSLVTTRIYLELEYKGDYTYLRYGQSEAELEQMEFFNIRNISGMSRGVDSGPDGPLTIYVELAKDPFGKDSKLLTYDFWRCTDDDYDLQTTADENILIPAGGEDYVLQATTEHPHARVFAGFTDSEGNTAKVELTKNGLTDDRCVFSLTIPADPTATIPGSNLLYSQIVSVELTAADLDGTAVGRTVTRSFSLRSLESIYIFGLENGAVSLGQGQSLRGIATPNSSLDVKISNDSFEAFYSAQTDASGLFTVPQETIGTEQSVLEITDSALGTVSLTVVIDIQAPVVTGSVEDESGSTQLVWQTDAQDVAGHRIYRNGQLLATLDGSARSWSAGTSIGSGDLYVVEIYDKAGNLTVLMLADGIALTDTLSYTWDEVNGILRLHGSGEMPENCWWPFGTNEVQQLELPEGLTRIAGNAFSNFAITSVVIPDSVEIIGDYAFAWCEDLETVQLGSGLQELWNSSFNGCAFETFHIPASVELIESAPFDRCENLHTITVAEDNPWFYAEDGVLFEKDGKALIRYPQGKTDAAYTVPDGVTALWQGAFRYTRVQELTISEDVEEVGYNCFFSCEALTTVHLPATMEYLYSLSFVLCPELDEITLAEGCESFAIDNGCLYTADMTMLLACFDKDGMTAWTAPETLTSVQQGAFSDCTALETVVLPNAGASIPWRCFTNCTALREITIPSTVYSVDYYAFENCDSLETVIFGGTQDMWEQLTADSDDGNEALRRAEVAYRSDYATSGSCGDSLTWSFDEETGLLTIEGSGEMDWYSGSDDMPWLIFRDRITAVSLPENLTNLSNYAFYGCEALTEVTLPENLYTMGYGVFYGSGLTAIHIPRNVREIGGSTFGNCPNLMQITVDRNNSFFAVENQALVGCSQYEDNKRLLRCFSSEAEYTVAADIRDIDSGAFAGNTTLTTLRLSEGVQKIHSWAFADCTGLELLRLPATVTMIDYGAFTNCENLTTVTYGGSETMWQRLMQTQQDQENDALLNADVTCSQITIVNGTVGEGMTWSLNLTDGQMTISGSGWCDWYPSDRRPWEPYLLEIRSLVVEEGVTALFSYAFDGAKNLTAVTLPDSYEYLGDYMFSHTGLTTFHVPASAYAEGGGTTFWGCADLTSFTVSAENETITAIDGVLFFDYDGDLNLIAYPSGRRDASYVLPDGTQYLNYSAFSGNLWLQELTIPEGIRSLGGELEGCNSLTTLHLPASIGQIETLPLLDLNSLETVTYAGTQQMWDSVTLYGDEDAVQAFRAMVQVSEDFETSGQKGTLSWHLNGTTGLLTISGTGEITNDYNNPWNRYQPMVKKLVVEEGITSIAYYAFQNMENLAEVSLPDSLTYLGGAVFYGAALTTLHIPAGVMEIDGGVLTGCNGVESITVDADNACFTAVDGVLYQRDETAEEERLLLSCYPPAKRDEVYTVLDNTLYIADYAARYNPYLKEIVLPEGLSAIYSRAFYDCKALTKVTLPSTLQHVSDEAFSGTALETAKYNGTRDQWDAEVYVGSYNSELLDALQVLPGGRCGSSAFWTIDEATGTLTISGTGETDLFGQDYAPWTSYAEEITAVQVAEGITGLGNHAFYGLTGLTAVSLPETLLYVGYRVFSGCTSLTTLALPDSVTQLGGYVFDGCTALESVKLPENLYSLPGYAFRSCGKLTSIALPVGINEIELTAFDGCTALEAILVDEDNTVFWSENGVLYGGTTLLYYPLGKQDTAFTVSDRAVEIGYAAFLKHPHLTELTLPEGVATIQTNAFSGCEQLTTVTLPKTLQTVYYSAFHNTGLTAVTYAGNQAQWEQITISDGNDPLRNAELTCLIKGVGGACGDLTWLLEDDTGLLTISGSGAMPDFAGSADTPWAAYADQITHLAIDAGVTRLGSYAFADLNGLTEAVIPEGVTALGEGLFQNCAQLAAVTIPTTVTAIPDGVFSYCAQLKTLYLHAGIEFFSPGAIHYNSLTGIQVDPANAYYWSQDGVLYSGNTLIAYPAAKADTVLVIPEQVRVLGEYAFYGTLIEDVTLPHGMTEIPAGCFMGSKLTTLRLTNSVTAVGAGAFGNTAPLTVHFAGAQEQWQNLTVETNNDSLTNADVRFENLSGVGADHLYWTMDYETGTLTISGKGTMTDYTSTETMPWANDVAYITRLVAEEGVVRMAAAVLGMPALQEIYLPASYNDPVMAIGNYFNGEEPNLTAIHVAQDNAQFRSVDGVLYSKDGKTLLAYPDGRTQTSYTVAEGTEIIDSEAFCFSRNLTEVILPAGLKEIESRAFWCCENLKILHIPASVTAVRELQFAEVALDEVYYGGTRQMWDALVETCGFGYAVETATIHCTDLSGTWGQLSWVIDGETGLLTISGEGPMNNMVAGDGWLAYSGAITSVEIQEGVTSLGERALQSCAAVTEVVLPQSITTVGSWAFNHCTGLKRVTFGKYVQSLGSYLLRDCPALETLVFPGDAPNVTLNDLADNAEQVTVICYEGRYGWPETWCGMPTRAVTPEGSERYFCGEKASVAYDSASGTITEAMPKLTRVIVPADLGITAIDQNAFTSCTGLKVVVLPKTVTAIAPNAFPAGTALLGAADSAAQTYAAENGLTFSVPKLTLSPANSSTIGGKNARVTATIDLYEALPLTLTYSGETPLTYKEAASGKVHTFEMDLTGLTEGEYTFTVSNDAYGVSAQALYLVDVTAPAAITGLRATGGNLRVTLTWDQAGEANVTKYHIYRAETEDGPRTLLQTLSGWNTVSWVDTTAEVDVPYWYWITAEDVFGQVSGESAPATGTAHKDEVPPEIVSVSPENGSTVKGTMELTVKATDNIALASVTAEVSADQEQWTSLGTVDTAYIAKFSCDTTQWDAELLYIRLSAVDMAGNTAQGSTIYRYAVDNKAPEAITGLYVKQALSTIVTLEWNDVADQDLSHFLVEQQVNGQWSVIRRVSDARGINLTGLTPGTAYTYRVSAVDQMGNAGDAAQITAVTAADTTAPVITSLRPAPGSYNASIPLRIQAADDHGLSGLTIQVSQDGGLSWNSVHRAENPTGTVSYDLDVSEMTEGLIRVRAVAVDKSGNYSDQSAAAPYVEYKVDRTAPAAPTGLDAVGGNGFITLSWPQAAEEDAAGYSLYRADSADGPFTCIKSNALTLSVRDNSVEYGKTYYYYLTLRDQTGNVSEASQIVSCTCYEDNEAPRILSISPVDGATVAASGSIRVKATDNNRLSTLYYTWSVDGGQETEGSMALSGSEAVQTLPIDLKSLTNETLTLRLWCTDSSDLTSAVTTVSYTVDGVAPTVPALTAALTDEGMALSWTASPESDTAGYIVYRRQGDGHWQKLLQRSAGQSAYAETDPSVECGKAYTYYIQAVDTRGNQADGQPLEAIFVPADWVGGQDVTPPVAVISGTCTGTVGIEMVFDSRSSWDDRQVVSRTWDFGDGGTSQLDSPAHAFEKAGTYTVSLTVADEAGHTHTASVQVEIKEKEVLGTLTVQVNDENGHGVSQVGVYFDLGDQEQTIVYTNSMGQATLQAPVGVHTVGAYREGYLPAKKDVEILSGAETAVTLVTVQKEIVTGELTVRRMTLEEIVAAGIDIHDPANQEIFEFEIHLTYGTTPLSVKTQVNGEGESLKNPDPIEIKDSTGNWHKLIVGVVNWPIGGGSGGSGSGSGGSGGGGGTPLPEKIPTVVVLDIPGTASWLKDFFEVQLTVINQAGTEFWLDDCLATLNVPSGLTLMDSNYTSSNPNVSMGSIGGQQSGTALWIVRGDKAGWYDLSADFSATLRDFNAAVSARFETKEPFEVRQNAGLSMELEVENTILANTDGALRIGLRNDHDLPYYMPNINLKHDGAYLKRSYKAVGSEILKDADMQTLNSGETMWFEYIIDRTGWKTLTARSDEDFYLHKAVVEAIGGTTTLPVNISELPPCSISADKIEVFQVSNGNEQPVELITINEKWLEKEYMPELRIKTYALQDDGSYELADMEVQVNDPYANKNTPGVQRIDTGVYSYGSYQIKSTEMAYNLNSGTIRITASRSFGGSNAYSRCRPAEIPVVIRGATAALGDIRVQVYGIDSSGVTAALSGASIVFSDGNEIHYTDKNGEAEIYDIPLSYHEIRISADGYMPLRDVIEIKEKEGSLYTFVMTQDPDPGNSKIVEVLNSLSGSSSGNVTVLPAGHVTGVLGFTLTHHLEGRDRFVGYRARIISGNRVVKTSDFDGTMGYSVDMSTLKEGDRIQFALVYMDSMTGEETCSKYTDSRVIVTGDPGVFENLFYSLSDMQHNIPLNPGKDFTLDISKPSEVFSQPLTLKTKEKLDHSGDTFNAMTDVVDGGSYGPSTKSRFFPLAVKYDPNGTLTVSVIFGGEEKSSTGAKNGFGGFALAGDMGKPVQDLSNSAAVFVDFIFRYNAALDNWSLTIRGGISASQSLLLAKGEFLYKLVYVSLKGELKEELVWEVFRREVGVLDMDGIIDGGLLPKTIAASFGLKGAAGVQAFCDDWASAGLFLRGNMNFRILPTARVEMEAAVGGEYRVLFWGNSKDFASNSWTLYPMGGNYSLRDMMLQEDSMLTVTAMPKNVVRLMNETPDLLVGNAFGGANPRMTKLPDDRIMMVWLNHTGDSSNPVTMQAAVYDGSSWSAAETLDQDGTPDLMPAVAATGQGAVAVWSDTTENLAAVQTITYAQLQSTMPENLGVSAAFYSDAEGWSEPIPVKTGTAAASPVAVSDGGRTMVAWIANDGGLEHSAESPEYIGWALLEDGQVTMEGQIPADGRNLSELKLGNYYGQFQLAVLKDDGTVQKIETAAFEGSGWSEMKQLNTINASDSILAYGGDGALYYLNNGRIMRHLGGTAVQVLSSALLDETSSGLSVTETEQGVVLTWNTVQNGEMLVCMSLVDSDDHANEPAVVFRGGEGLVTGCDAEELNGDIMLAVLSGKEEELTGGTSGLVYDLLVPRISQQPNLVLEDGSVTHLGTLYAGNEIVTSICPTVRGIIDGGGFSVTIARDSTGSDPIPLEGGDLRKAFPGQRSASVHWTVPADYNGENLYLLVTPLNGADSEPSDNVMLLDNVVQEVSVENLIYAGKQDGQDTFLLTVNNDGLSVLEDLQVEMTALQEGDGEQSGDRVVLTHTIDRLAVGEARTVKLTAAEALELSQELRLMASIDKLDNEVDYSNNRAYITVAAQQTDAGMLIHETGWTNADGVQTETFGSGAVTYRVQLENLGNEAADVRAMAACYDADGKFLRLAVGETNLAGQDSGELTLTLAASQLTGAATVKAFVLDSSDAPLCEAAALTKATE